MRAKEGVEEGGRRGDVGEEEAEGREAGGEDAEAEFDEGPEEELGDGDCEGKGGGLAWRWGIWV